MTNTHAILDIHRIKYGSNSRVALITCAVKHNSFGTIHKLNKEALK